MKQQVNYKMCAEKIKSKLMDSLNDTLVWLEIKLSLREPCQCEQVNYTDNQLQTPTLENHCDLTSSNRKPKHVCS